MNSNSHSSKYGNGGGGGNSGGGSGLLGSQRAKDGGGCGSSGEDADSEMIDMTDNEEEDDNESDCDSFDSRYSKGEAAHHLESMGAKKDSQDLQGSNLHHRSTTSSNDQQLSPKGGTQPPIVPSPVKQMAQHSSFGGADLAASGAFSLPNLANLSNLFLPAGGNSVGGTPTTATSPPLGGTPGSFLDSATALSAHLDAAQHAHYLSALHQQQQQAFLFNSAAAKLAGFDAAAAAVGQFGGGGLQHGHSHHHHHHSASAFRKVK